MSDLVAAGDPPPAPAPAPTEDDIKLSLRQITAFLRHNFPSEAGLPALFPEG